MGDSFNHEDNDIFSCVAEIDKSNLYIGHHAGWKLLHHIEMARESIRVVSPFITSYAVEKLRDKKLGCMNEIKISIITTAEDEIKNLSHEKGIRKLIYRKKILKKQERDQYEYEYKPIFESVFFRGSFLHTKLYIIDEQTAFLGSVNFTKKGITDNIETSILIEDNETVKKLCAYYKRLFMANKYKWNIDDLGKKVYANNLLRNNSTIKEQLQ